jgi:endogenous inhibitor of DNA gyrase (YacG/DUF329 family)
MAAYRCASCEKEVTCAGHIPELYPFCSERCRMVDLGRWFRESYLIDRDLSPEDMPSNHLTVPGSDHRSDE